MVSVQRSIEIRVPVHTLYNQLTQFEDYPQFMHDIESVEQVDDTHLHWKTKSEEGSEEWDAVISEQVPDKCIAWHTETGPSNSGRVELQSVGPAASRLTLTMVTERDPEPTTPAGDIKAEMSEKIWEDLTKLRNLIESRGQESGAWRGEVHDAQVTMQDRSGTEQETHGQEGHGYETQDQDIAQLAGLESGPVADLGVAQGTGDAGNTAGRDGIDEVARLGSVEGTENGRQMQAAQAQGESAAQESGPVAELGVAQGTGQVGNTAGRDGIDEVAKLGSIEGMAQGQESDGKPAATEMEMMMRDRGSPGNPIPASGFTQHASPQDASPHHDPADSAFRQVSIPHPVDPTQSGYSLSQDTGDSLQGSLHSIAEEVSFDQQSDAARHVGNLPEDDSDDGNTGVPRYDAIGKVMQRGRPEPEV